MCLTAKNNPHIWLFPEYTVMFILGGVDMKFIVMDLDDFIFGNEEWHQSER